LTANDAGIECLRDSVVGMNDMTRKMTLANRLTILRILLIPLFIICATRVQDEGYEWTVFCALGVFAVMALTDALDGFFARRRSEVTQLGSYLDPLADKMLMTTACILLSTSYWPEWSRLLWYTPVIIISRDVFILLGALLIFLVNGHLKVQPTTPGKITTVAQMCMILYVLICQSIYTTFSENLPEWLNWLLPGMWGLQWVAIGWTVLSWIGYIIIGNRQLNERVDITRAGEDTSSPKKPVD
jgi:CDP-diacylglycerol--glycerol-3-phosphate 3-phosphatidyltransferase